MRLLVLNPGSSTLKASVVEAGAEPLAAAEAAWPAGDVDADTVVNGLLEQLPTNEVEAIGCRVVHGASTYREPTVVDDRLLRRVDALDALAPLHNRRAAAVMRAVGVRFVGIPQVACFDTAFHADLPETAWRYALPRDWVDRWSIRRYGFHGLSVQWATRRAAQLLDRSAEGLAIAVAHLGSGSSVTAVLGGRAVDTTMGFTPFEGLVMGTRSGSVDPGILLHLLREGMDLEALADGLAHRSGLLGLSGTTPDVRELERLATTGDASALLALEIYAARAAAGIAAMATSLPRLDGVVFTGGIGEHSHRVRSSIARRLTVLGVPEPGDRDEGDAVVAAGPPALLVVKAREDRQIADLVEGLLA
ncbi:MAG: acetate/propionate family kinase [Chloroflexota bacterium]